MPFSGPLEDRELIRELLARYADAVTRQDLDGYLDCWTEDGVRTGPGGDCSGTDELRAQWHGIFGAVEQMTFFAQAGAIEVDGDHATVRSHCLEFIRLRDGSSRQVIGEYADTVRRENGRWAFAVRAYTVAMG
jgi:uncharacterized protein (TIGR02246 family)